MDHSLDDEDTKDEQSIHRKITYKKQLNNLKNHLRMQKNDDYESISEVSTKIEKPFKLRQNFETP